MTDQPEKKKKGTVVPKASNTMSLIHKSPFAVSDATIVMATSWDGLRYCVKTVSWNAVEQTIDLILRETVDFDVYGWFTDLGKPSTNYISTEEQESLFISYMNDENEIAMTFRFLFLELVDHKCDSHNFPSSIVGELSTPLEHRIRLKYGEQRKLTAEDISQEKPHDYFKLK